MPLQFGSQLAHGQKFQHPLLHLLQAEVVPVQHLAGSFHADPLLGALAPGQLQAHIQVVAHNGGLRGAERLLGQAAHFFLQALPHHVGQRSLGDLLAVVADVVAAPLPFAQLGLDGLHLLPKVVVPLVVGHLLPGAVLDLHIQAQDLNFPAQQAVQTLQAAHGAQLLQHRLLVIVAHGDVLGNKVGDVAGVLAGQHVDEQVGSRLGGQVGVLLEHLIGGADQGLGLGGVAPRLLLRDGPHLGLQIGGGADDLLQAAPAVALHHDPDVVPGHAEDLPHLGDGAHAVQVLLLRLLLRKVLLSHQEHGTACGHGLLQSLDGHIPGHVKVDEHMGENGQPTQGDHRHGLQFFFGPILFHNSHFLSGE